MVPPHSNLNSLTELGFSQEAIQTVPEHYASNPDRAAEYLYRQARTKEQTDTSNQWPADSQKDALTSSASSYGVPGSTGFRDTGQSDWGRTAKSSSQPDKASRIMPGLSAGAANPHEIEEQNLQKALRLSKEDYERSSKLGAGQSDGMQLLLGADQSDLEMQRVLAESVMDQKAGNVTYQDEDPRKRRRESLSEPLGLCNIGNTCYFNSLLQLYFNLDEFRRSILSFSPPASRQNSATHPQQSPAPTSVAEKPTEQNSSGNVAIDFVVELQRLFAFMALGNQRFANPKNLFQVMQKCGHNISLGSQEDAQEFAFKLLEIAEKAVEIPPSTDVLINQKAPQSDVIAPPLSPKSQTDSRIDVDVSSKATAVTAAQSAASHVYQPRVKREVQNFVKNIFTLKVRYETMLDPQSSQQKAAEAIRRMKPNGVLSSYPGDEPSVLVNINGLADQDIYDGLDDFTHQILDYRLDRENEEPKNVRAVKRMFFTKIPPVLTVWLKRHTYNRESGAGKAETKFQFHQEIALDRYLSENRDEADEVREKVRALQAKRRELKHRLECINYFGITDTAQYRKGERKETTLGESITLALRRASLRIQSAVRDQRGEMHVEGLSQEQASNAISVLKKIVDNDEGKCTAIRDQIAALDADERDAYSNMQNAKYRLQAVLIHEGAGSGGGHYWTYIRNRYVEENSKRWIKFNDRLVSYVSEEEMWNASLGGKGRPSSAYCIVYVSHDGDRASATNDNGMEIVTQGIADEARRLLPSERLAEIEDQNEEFEREIEKYEKELETAEIDHIARRLIVDALSKVREGTTPSVPMTTSSTSIGGSLNEWKDYHCLKNLVVFLSWMGFTSLAFAQALVCIWGSEQSTGDKLFFELLVEEVRASEFPPFNKESTPPSSVSRPCRILQSLVNTISQGPSSYNWPDPDPQVVPQPVSVDLGERMRSIEGLKMLCEDLDSWRCVYLIALCFIKLQAAALFASLNGDWWNALDFWYIVTRGSVTDTKIPGVPNEALMKAASEFRNNPALDFARGAEQLDIFISVLIAASEHAVELLREQQGEGAELGMKAARQIMLFSAKTEMPYKTLVQIWEEVLAGWANNPRHKLGHGVAEEILMMLRASGNSVSVDQTDIATPDVIDKAKTFMDEATKDPEGTVKEYEDLLTKMQSLDPTARDPIALRSVAERIRLSAVQFDG